MTKRKTVQVSFSTTVTVELPVDAKRLVSTPDDLAEFVEGFEGTGVDSDYGRAWLVFVDADTAVVL